MANHLHILPLACTCRDSLREGSRCSREGDGRLGLPFLYTPIGLHVLGVAAFGGGGGAVANDFYILPLACTWRESLPWGAPWLTIFIYSHWLARGGGRLHREGEGRLG